MQLVWTVLLALLALNTPQAQARGYRLAVDDSTDLYFDREGRASLIDRTTDQVYFAESQGSLHVRGDSILIDGSTVGYVTSDRAQFCPQPLTCVLVKSRRDGPEGLVLTFQLTTTDQELISKSDDHESGRSYTALLPYVSPSPNQEDAGTCLYMAHTGAMEIHLLQAHHVGFKAEGPYDLSERFLINAGARVHVNNWLTDTVNIFNQMEGAVRNSDFRFTKGWVRDGANGYEPSSKGQSGAYYSAAYNWIDGLNDQVLDKKVETPTLARKVLYADPDGNQWNTGGFPADIADQIKKSLVTYQAPVVVIYNHFGYWHANLVVGFDDNKVVEGCPFVKRFQSYMTEQANKARSSGTSGGMQRAAKFLEAVNGVQDAIDSDGGCSSTGTFYVRDSIYDGDQQEGTYDYDLSQPGEESSYSKRIIEHSYNFARYLGNHAYVIYRR